MPMVMPAPRALVAGHPQCLVLGDPIVERAHYLHLYTHESAKQEVDRRSFVKEVIDAIAAAMIWRLHRVVGTEIIYRLVGLDEHLSAGIEVVDQFATLAGAEHVGNRQDRCS